MVPRHSLGYLYRKGESTVVIWADDKSYEVAPDSEATTTALEEFGTLLALAYQARLPNMLRVHELLLSAGWQDAGTYRFDFRSGNLYQNALTQARLAANAYAERTALLDAHNGRHPPLHTDAWDAWVDCSGRWSATANGARMLAIASVEALVNEILLVMHPDHYDQWEVRGRKPTVKKIDLLIDLHGIDPPPRWVDDFRSENDLRRELVHHKPGFIVDDKPEDSVEPDVSITPTGIGQTVAAVERVMTGLFDLYGSEVPDTHQPYFDETI